MTIKNILRKLLFLEKTDTIAMSVLLKRWNIKFGPYIYKKKYTTEEIVNVLKEMGVNKGSNIFIHSSWDSFYNYNGNEKTLLNALIELIGETGTIAMPSFPIKNGKIFNVKKTVTAAGRMNEIFRRYPGVKRSLNVRNPVCALGPLSEYLTDDHQNSLVCWDEHSPYYKICEKQFTVVKLGLPKYFIGSFQYCSQAVLRKEIPYFSQFYDENVLEINRYIDWEGKEKQYKSISEPKFFHRSSYIWVRHIIKKNIPKGKYLYKNLSGLGVSCVDCSYIHNKFCELARKNIFIYNFPVVKKSQKIKDL